MGDRDIDPSVDTIDGFAFNGTATIVSKVDFARERNLAGVMIWELGQDSVREDASLLATIEARIRRVKE